MNCYGKAAFGAVHHITSLAFLKLHRPDVDPNHPLNLVTIDHNNHNLIHKDWVYYYDKNPELIKEQVLYGGARGWVNEYDEVLTGIAIIRSFDYMQEEPSFYPMYQEEIAYHYEMLEPDFVYRYRAFS